MIRRAAIAGAALAAAGFMILAFLAHGTPYFPIDLAITRAVQGQHGAWFEALLAPFNWVGFPPRVGILYGSIAALVFAAGRRREALVLGLTASGGAGLNFLTKTLVDRPRPSPELIQVAHQITSGAFPAGHVLNFTGFAGLLGYLACRRAQPAWLRAATFALFAAMIAVMGVARIDSGEHWPSDVLGGYLLGFAWLVAMIEFHRWLRHRDRAGDEVRPGPDARDDARCASGTGPPDRAASPPRTVHP